MSKTNEGLTNSHILFSDEEAAPLPQQDITSWADTVQKYGLSPLEQDAFLCFLRAHGHPTAALPPKQMDVLYHHWKEYEEERNESRVSRLPGQLPFDALVDGYHLSPVERDAFLRFVESKGFKKTTRLPVLEALHDQLRRR